MAFDYLLCNCLMAGQTTAGENGRGVKLERLSGETILFFAPDNETVRKQTRDFFGVDNYCDVVVYYKNEDDHCVIIFIELKGKDVPHAVRQLESAIVSFYNKAPLWKRKVKIKAVIVSTGGSPAGIADDARRFSKNLHADLKQRTMQKGRLDLRLIIQEKG